MGTMKLPRESKEKRRKVRNRICLSLKPWPWSWHLFFPITQSCQCLLTSPSPSLASALKPKASMKLVPLPPQSSGQHTWTWAHVTFLLITPHNPCEAAINFLILQIEKIKAKAGQVTCPGWKKISRRAAVLKHSSPNRRVLAFTTSSCCLLNRTCIFLYLGYLGPFPFLRILTIIKILISIQNISFHNTSAHSTL